MSNKVSYENGGIRIPMGAFPSIAPQINTQYVENRLSQDELQHFWVRLQQEIGCNFTCNRIWLVMYIVEGFLTLLFLWMLRPYPIPSAATYSIIIILTATTMFGMMNIAMLVNKMKAFLEKENNEYWETKGLHWKFGGSGINLYVEVKITHSAVEAYQPPVQFSQSHSEEGLPDSNSQFQADFYAKDQLGDCQFHFLILINLDLVSYGQQQYGQQQYGQQPQQYQGIQAGIQHPQYVY